MPRFDARLERWLKPAIRCKADVRRSAVSQRARVAAPYFLVTLLSLALVALESGEANAGPGQDNLPTQCRMNSGLQVNTSLSGTPSVGSFIEVAAADPQVIVPRDRCLYEIFPVTNRKWLLSTPAGSHAQLSGVGSLRVRLIPDAIGQYTITLVICQGGCGAPLNLPEQSFPTTVNVTQSAPTPPESIPLLPPSTQVRTQPLIDPAKAMCEVGNDFGFWSQGGILGPQWRAVKPFKSPKDYQRVDGLVVASRVSAQDNALNHTNWGDVHDMNPVVQPFPSYGNMMQADQDEMEIEWENSQWPEVLRPAAGDILSSWGFWIHDCGHPPFSTEIHPPVGVAVQRARPISIPSTAQVSYTGGPSPVGQNVIVPGIISDLWFNTEGGQITRCANRYGLHQPPILALPAATRPLVCIGREPIARSYTFDIYLPPSPQVVLQRAGFPGRPSVPLYWRVEDIPTLGADHPVSELIKPITEGDSTRLHVTIVMPKVASSLHFAQRITAGWAFADSENWGVRQWHYSVKGFQVTQSGDLTQADWRMWVWVPNGGHEWTRLVDCNGCIGEREYSQTSRVGLAPWETDHLLGPDPLFFPGQALRFHTDAYDDDVLFDDDTGQTFMYRPQAPFDGDLPSILAFDGSYIVHLAISPGPPVRHAALSPAAVALRDAYLLARVPLVASQLSNGIQLGSFRPSVRRPTAAEKFPQYEPKECDTGIDCVPQRFLSRGFAAALQDPKTAPVVTVFLTATNQSFAAQASRMPQDASAAAVPFDRMLRALVGAARVAQYAPKVTSLAAHAPSHA